MSIFEDIYDFFYARVIDIEYFFQTRGKMYECTRSKHSMYIGNAYNRDAKKFNVKADFNGLNEDSATYAGHDYISIKEDLNFVYFKDVINYLYDKYGDSIKIRRITFITQYSNKHRKNKYSSCIYLTGDEEKDKAIVEKADSIFREWTENRPKYLEFRQSDWEL